MTARAYIVDPAGTRTASRAEAEAAIGSAEFVWIHLDGRADDTRAWLQGRGLDHLVVNALMATETRPRAEPIDGGAIINLRGLDATPEESEDLLASIRLWATRDQIISVTMHDLVAMATLDGAMLGGQIRDAGDWLATLAGAITAGLDPDVAQLGDSLDDCEEHLEGKSALMMRSRIARVRARAITYRRFMAPQRQALERLASANADWLEADDKLHIAEGADRAARMVEELESIRERAALMHEQLTDLRAELIDTRSLVISVVALVFLPLTFLTGLLGMNVAGIPYAQEPWAFWGVCGVCAVIALSVGWYFVRARWFR